VLDEMRAQATREVANLEARFPEMGWENIGPEEIERNLLILVTMEERFEDCRHCQGAKRCKVEWQAIRRVEVDVHGAVRLWYGTCREARPLRYWNAKTSTWRFKDGCP
jgi:hypothetical protein